MAASGVPTSTRGPGCWAVTVGYGRPGVAEAVREQLRRLSFAVVPDPASLSPHQQPRAAFPVERVEYQGQDEVGNQKWRCREMRQPVHL